MTDIDTGAIRKAAQTAFELDQAVKGPLFHRKLAHMCSPKIVLGLLDEIDRLRSSAMVEACEVVEAKLSKYARDERDPDDGFSWARRQAADEILAALKQKGWVK